MKATNTQRKAQREIRKMVAPNEVTNWKFNGDDDFFLVTVEMPSTCEANATMTWEYTVSYTPSNEDAFTELEKHEYPEMIIKESLTITQV